MNSDNQSCYAEKASSHEEDRPAFSSGEQAHFDTGSSNRANAGSHPEENADAQHELHSPIGEQLSPVFTSGTKTLSTVQKPGSKAKSPMVQQAPSLEKSRSQVQTHVVSLRKNKRMEKQHAARKALWEKSQAVTPAMQPIQEERQAAEGDQMVDAHVAEADAFIEGPPLYKPKTFEETLQKLQTEQKLDFVFHKTLLPESTTIMSQADPQELAQARNGRFDIQLFPRVSKEWLANELTFVKEIEKELSEATLPSASAGFELVKKMLTDKRPAVKLCAAITLRRTILSAVNEPRKNLTLKPELLKDLLELAFAEKQLHTKSILLHQAARMTGYYTDEELMEIVLPLMPQYINEIILMKLAYIDLYQDEIAELVANLIQYFAVLLILEQKKIIQAFVTHHTASLLMDMVRGFTVKVGVNRDIEQNLLVSLSCFADSKEVEYNDLRGILSFQLEIIPREKMQFDVWEIFEIQLGFVSVLGSDLKKAVAELRNHPAYHQFLELLVSPKGQIMIYLDEAISRQNFFEGDEQINLNNEVLMPMQSLLVIVQGLIETQNDTVQKELLQHGFIKVLEHLLFVLTKILDSTKDQDELMVDLLNILAGLVMNISSEAEMESFLKGTMLLSDLIEYFSHLHQGMTFRQKRCLICLFANLMDHPYDLVADKLLDWSFIKGLLLWIDSIKTDVNSREPLARGLKTLLKILEDYTVAPKSYSRAKSQVESTIVGGQTGIQLITEFIEVEDDNISQLALEILTVHFFESIQDESILYAVAKRTFEQTEVIEQPTAEKMEATFQMASQMMIENLMMLANDCKHALPPNQSQQQQVGPLPQDQTQQPFSQQINEQLDQLMSSPVIQQIQSMSQVSGRPTGPQPPQMPPSPEHQNHVQQVHSVQQPYQTQQAYQAQQMHQVQQVHQVQQQHPAQQPHPAHHYTSSSTHNPEKQEERIDQDSGESSPRFKI